MYSIGVEKTAHACSHETCKNNLFHNCYRMDSLTCTVRSRETCVQPSDPAEAMRCSPEVFG